MTCTSRSEPATSSSVARNAATSECGSRSMKPTVSETSSSRRSGRRTLADERIERHEQRVRRHRGIARQHVEQRRLAGVGVADQRNRRHCRLLPPLARLLAPPADQVDLFREHADAVPDPAAIGFEFGFAGASRADAAAEPRQRGARADQPRQQVLQLRQLDLQLAFARARALRAKMSRMSWVRSRTLRSSAFSRLRSCAGVSSLSKMTTSAPQLVARLGERCDLAAAEERRGIRLGAILQHAQHDSRAGRRRQGPQVRRENVRDRTGGTVR